MKKTITSIATVATSAVLLAAFIVSPANAATNSANAAAKLAKVIAKSDTAITARITALNNLNTRVADLKNVSATAKSNVSASVQTNISGLTALKAKIDADTDGTTALADAKTITANYRIYALVIPQGYILASSDRVSTIVGILNTLSGKLETRITDAGTAGKDTTALKASLSDYNAKMADASAQGQAAESGVGSLTPDQGNASVLASNTAALKASRADIKTATADIKAARADAATIVAGLKAFHLTTGTSAGVSATATVQ